MLTEDKALYCYIKGLKDAPRKWVRMRLPLTLQEAELIAAHYDATFMHGGDGQEGKASQPKNTKN